MAAQDNDTIYALGVFTHSQNIEQVVNQLKASGFPMEKVSIIVKDKEQVEHISETQTSNDASPRIGDRIGNQDVDTTGAVGDTLTATTWGSVLFGLSSLAIPGLGALIAAGSVGVALVASIGGVAVGAAATQNLIAALTNFGIPKERARVYSDRLQQNDYLLILNATQAEINQAEPILRDRGIEYWGTYQNLPSESSGSVTSA